MYLNKRGVIMKEFWKNEWQLFLNDMPELGEFCLQQDEITVVPWKKSAALKPSVEEIEQKCDQVGFWQNEWNLFKQDLQNAKDFLMQPVEFK